MESDRVFGRERRREAVAGLVFYGKVEKNKLTSKIVKAAKIRFRFAPVNNRCGNFVSHLGQLHVVGNDLIVTIKCRPVRSVRREFPLRIPIANVGEIIARHCLVVAIFGGLIITLR